jgi:DNA-binding MurR/RpiR family transcriptional regulator
MNGGCLMEKTVLQSLEDKMESFTSAQRKVADYILKNPTEVPFMTTDQLAVVIGVSVATVMRLTYTLGYTGYSHFQRDLQELFRNRMAPPERLESNVRKLGKNKLLIGCAEIQISNIKKTVEFLSEEAINNAVDLMLSARKIYVMGIRGSLAVSIYLNEGLNRIGMECEHLTPDSGRLQSILVKMCPSDLLIAVSLPRYAKRTLEVVQVSKAKGAKILSLTDGYASQLALLSDVALACAYESVSFHNSEVGVMFLADFLISSMAAKNPEKAKRHLEEIEQVVKIVEANVLK